MHAVTTCKEQTIYGRKTLTILVHLVQCACIVILLLENKFPVVVHYDRRMPVHRNKILLVCYFKMLQISIISAATQVLAQLNLQELIGIRFTGTIGVHQKSLIIKDR